MIGIMHMKKKTMVKIDREDWEMNKGADALAGEGADRMVIPLPVKKEYARKAKLTGLFQRGMVNILQARIEKNKRKEKEGEERTPWQQETDQLTAMETEFQETREGRDIIGMDVANRGFVLDEEEGDPWADLAAIEAENMDPWAGCGMDDEQWEENKPDPSTHAIKRVKT